MKAWIAYAICAVVWGSTYFAIALGITAFTPFGMVATRYLLGGAVAFGLSRMLGEDLPLRRDLPHLAFVGVLLLGCSNALVTWAERFVPSGVTAILCSMTPLLYGLMGREALGLRRWCGLGLGLLGVVVLSRPGQAAFPAGGIAAILMATTAWAYGTLHGKRHVRGHGLLGQVAVQMGAGGLLALVLVPFTGGFLHAPLTAKAALAVGYLTVFGSVVAFSAFAYLAKVWPPTRMSTYAYLNPLVAVLLGSAFLLEPFGPRVVAGMAVILAGVALVQFQPRTAPTEIA
ncbi:EamA family transporter [Mesoterricola silvestris]|uniref:Drug/metabolite exporter YedA n=1 Tax=Mesoterricola silvestris TaxID=2927979 RepID=A0AA48K824_9BACT|nr:EamA family transporter [Mesoterricola silvestris]BDU70897.1 drug/metabolite exporter YedA [Mesoterricola silvestris]